MGDPAAGFCCTMISVRRSFIGQHSRRATLVCLLAAPLVTDPAAAWGAGDGLGAQHVAVLRLEFAGNIPDAGRELFSTRLTEGLAAAGFQVLAGDAVDAKLAGQGDASTCREAACFPRVAELLEVPYLVSGRVTESNKSYAIALKLVNGRTGATVAGDNERCETCGIEDAGEKMALAAAALRARIEALARAPARFIIRSQPSSATTLVDGKAVGTTPLDLELTGGRHTLTLSLNGYGRRDRTFTVVNGLDETLDLDLVARPGDFPYTAVGWASIAVGALAVVAGVWAIWVDGKEVACAAAEQDKMNHCPYVHKTSGLGAGLIGLGAASASLGGVSLFLGSHSSSGARGDGAAATKVYGLALNRTF